MILLVTPSARADECVKAIRENTGENVDVAGSLRRAASLLRSQSYLAVVFDQHLFELEPNETETTMQHLGTAIPIQMSLAVSGAERVVREVRAALNRRVHEQLAARRDAVCQLHSELSGTVTALLLECELALQSPGLSPPAVEKLHNAHELVQRLRAQLENGTPQGGPYVPGR